MLGTAIYAGKLTMNMRRFLLYVAYVLVVGDGQGKTHK